MSVIPYSGLEIQSIVLRDPIRGAVVLYNHESRQLSLRRDLVITSRSSSPDSVAALERSPSPRDQSQVQPVFRGQIGRDISQSARYADETEMCPYCGGRIHSTNGIPLSPHANPAGSNGIFLGNRYLSDDVDSVDSDTRTFVDSNYFQLLHNVESFGSVPSVTETDSTTPKLSISASAFSQGYFERFFVTERELGRGGRGAVYLVEHVLDGISLGRFACKKVPVGDDHKWLEHVLREVNLLRLRHDNLVNYNHVWLEDATLTNFGPSVPFVFILQEYCNGGTLEDYVTARSGRTSPTIEELKLRARMLSKKHEVTVKQQKREFLTVEEIGSFFADMTAGLNHLHKNGFVHRDLKPSNCLLTRTDDHPGSLPRVLVSDFGEGQREGALREATGATGTVEYLAPETLLADANTGRLTEFSFKTDMFSLGMILHYMCFSRLPYDHNADTEFYELTEDVMHWQGFDNAKVSKIRSDLPSILHELLSKLLSPNPDERPSAEELLDLVGSSAEYRKRRSSSSGTTGTGSSTSLWRVESTSPASSVTLFPPSNATFRDEKVANGAIVPAIVSLSNHFFTPSSTQSPFINGDAVSERGSAALVKSENPTKLTMQSHNNISPPSHACKSLFSHLFIAGVSSLVTVYMLHRNSRHDEAAKLS
ncbi:kinase-like domain-containing protein [Lipomyces arxii]|uniref:kinase-like domain-containing protein n=1 Tax=Lipomyces arxii TaxID=56418 RepID=UPI0034CF4E40